LVWTTPGPLASLLAPYGVRRSSIGNGRDLPFGVRMTVNSFVPSRVAIIASRRSKR
jgi:hypothetical protein